MRTFECFQVNPDGRRQLTAYSYIECFSDRWHQEWSSISAGMEHASYLFRPMDLDGSDKDAVGIIAELTCDDQFVLRIRPMGPQEVLPTGDHDDRGLQPDPR